MGLFCYFHTFSFLVCFSCSTGFDHFFSFLLRGIWVFFLAFVLRRFVVGFCRTAKFLTIVSRICARPPHPLVSSSPPPGPFFVCDIGGVSNFSLFICAGRSGVSGRQA